MKTILTTTDAPGAIGPYSQGIATQSLVFTSGQLPIDVETGELKGEIKEATKACLNNIEAILKQKNIGLENVVKTVVYLKNIDDFAQMNEVYATYFKENPPARSCFEVARLPKDAIIEIEAIAVIS